MKTVKENYDLEYNQLYENEMKKIKSDPRKYIGDWMEQNLLHVGRKTFKVICLMPCSMILPSIPWQSTDIRSNINLFILGPPGSGKSTIASIFVKIGYSGFMQKGITSKRLIDKIRDYNGFFSIAIDDFANVLNQNDSYDLIKILEGALGDEKNISYETKKTVINQETHAIGLVEGTWTDLEKFARHMQGGLLSRMSLLFISLDEEQREEVADFINLGIGNKSSSNISKLKEQVVKDYYRILFEIQNEEKDEKENLKHGIEKVKAYQFDDNYKGIALKTWKRQTINFASNINGDFKREFHDFYRFVVSHAFLNIFNRDCKDGVLKPIEEDYKFALNLMMQTIRNKTDLIQSQIFLRNLSSTEELLKIINDPDLKNQNVKNIVLNLSKKRKINL